MNIGNAITSIALADLFDKNNETPAGTHYGRQAIIGNQVAHRQRGSNSFAEHPERW